MTFLLDTNAVVALFNGNSRLMGRLLEHALSEFAISVIVSHELFYGAYKGQRTAETLARIDRLAFAVIPVDTEDARMAGEIRATLARAGTPIGPYDVLIAGQALARDCTLITRNVREFTRVPLLRVENWED